MFCPTNEKIQNFTEKTKLLAQKCTQQIRVAAQQHLQQQQQQQQQQNFSSPIIIDKNEFEDQQNLKSKNSTDTTISNNIKNNNSHNNSNNNTTNCSSISNSRNNSNNIISKNVSNNSNNGSNSNSGNNINLLCSCTGGTLKAFKKNKDGQATVKWYVKPTWRLWGEEREKDAIFTVYLKKVRYHRPTPSANNDSDDEISHLEWETVRVRFVKGATLARLVEALATDDGELESTFINVFLSTYRTFSNLKEILELLIKRYDKLNEMILNDEKYQLLNHNVDDSNDCNNLKEYKNQQKLQSNHYYNESVSSTKSLSTSISSTSTTTTTTSSLSDSIYEQHKKTLVSALYVWLDGFPEDWNENNLRLLLNFTSKRLSHSELHTKVLQRLERFIRLSTSISSSSRLNNEHNFYYNNCQQQDQQYWLNNSSYSPVTAFLSSSISTPLSAIASPLYGTKPLSSASSSSDLTELFGGMCLAPAFRGPPSHLLQAYRFPHIPVKHFAEQLTRMDMELFKRLIPHQCLGATWAKRDKNEADTVVATVNQFNAVSYRVISSILIEPRLKPQERALHLAAWIDIAQELRLLKNFSSLKAIISGLQSNAVYRLSKTWAALSKEKLEIFNELARIFSEDNNAWTQREVLMREGTAKFADTVGENDRHLQKVFQKQNTHTSHGTIPYLGTFLTDLTMIHAAIPDTIGEGLINFDKKRKEFEILAQIKLLQGAANAYNLKSDHHFDRWFASMLVLDEREAHTISCQLEPPPETKSKSNNSSIASGLGLNISGGNYGINAGCGSGGNYGVGSTGGNCSGNTVGVGYGHKKSDSITSNSSSGAGSQFYYEINTATASMTTATSSSNTSKNNSRNNSLDRDALPPNSSLISASSSVSNLSIDSNNSGGGGGVGNKTGPLHKCNGKSPGSSSTVTTAAASSLTNNGIPIINAQLVQTPQMKNVIPDFYIIRVTYETDNVETNGIVLYKSIMLGNNERTPQVIRNAMMKLGLDDDPDKWTLSQVLPDKELLMPPNANVYYAVNTAYNLNFILRHKKDDNNSNNSSNNSIRGQ